MARTIVLLLLVTAVMVYAQTAPPSQKAPAAKPAATQAKPAAAPAPPSPFAKPAPAKAATAAPAKAATAAPAKSAKPAATPAKPATAKAAKPAAKPAEPETAKAAKPAAKPAKRAAAKTAAKPGTVAKAKAKGKRDPFVSPIVRAEGTVACATGKKCLAIDSIVLKGTVKSQVGMIAVVESSARKLSYFLRENDPVFNGYVVKITRDSVVFRENVMDALGRQSTREVVKKVVAPVV